MDAPIKLLPGQKLSSGGRLRLDYRAVAALAFPFMLNSAVQAVLNATDTWFIGRLSPAATSAIGAVYWPILVCVLLFGGIGLSVQTSVAQAFGGRRYTRASQATWNQLFMFDFGMGIAGSGWATDAAQLIGVATAAALFLGRATRERYGSHLTTRLQARALLRQFKLGFPMGLLIAADILGFALFQLMQVRLGTVDGASTQIVMMLTSFCYMPAVGIAMAGTTLVGQAIGRRTLGDALLHQWRRSRGRGRGGAGMCAALDCRRVSALRRLQHQQQRLSAGRGRRAPSGRHGPRVVLAAFRAACA
jgi:Na+-driven multidrug efflux pump